MSDRPDLTPLGEPADVPAEGATVVIEGATAEAALQQVHDQLGPDARIVEVRRVGRGGLGGFFVREVVELHAAPSAPPAPAVRPATVAPALAPTTFGAVSPVDRLIGEDADPPETVDFAAYLRRQVAQPATATAPTEVAGDVHTLLLERATAAARAAVSAASGGGVVDPVTGTVSGPDGPDLAVPTATDAPADDVEVVTAPTDDVEVAAAPAADVDGPADGALAEPPAARDGGPAWSVVALIKLGLPAELVRNLDVVDPADDVCWTAALAGALRPVCRPLPSGRSLLVGPRSRGVATALGVPVTAVGQPIRSRATTVAAAVGSGAGGQRWLERTQGNRWLHLVVGGQGWRTLLHRDPLAVSWASGEDVAEAIRLAVELGLVLGAGPVRGQVQRARPLDVALAVRDLLPVHP